MKLLRTSDELPAGAGAAGPLGIPDTREPDDDARWWWAVAAVVAAVALVARLLPLLNGGGFKGLGNYDDGVYFGAAVALSYGYLPYRDFLLLHPPGVVLALTPFAVLGRLTSDSLGWAAARLTWMLLGALSAVLVARILRPVDRYAAVLGGLCYALFYPAIYAEISTQLQGLANVCLLGSLALLARGLRGRLPSTRSVVLAGSLLAAAACVKIWGAVAILLVVAWVLKTDGARRAGALVAGVGIGGMAICLPFFLPAPSTMWRDVVTAQLGRSRSSVTTPERVHDMVGLILYPNRGLGAVLTVVAVVALAVAVVLAWREAQVRLAVVLAFGLGALLLASPSWFQHYPALTAPSVALIIGAAGQRVVQALGGRQLTGRVVAVLLVGLLVASALPVASAKFGRRFPADQLSTAVADLPGCVTSDRPTPIILLNFLSRNFERGCPVMVDLGGYSYVLEGPGERWPRSEDQLWQDLALDHLGSGTVSIVIDTTAGSRFSRASLQRVRTWPVLVRAGRYRLHSPQPAGR